VGLVALPAGINWRHVGGLSCLGGLGFTMSLFIATLAFGSGQLLETAKLGILAASLLAGVLGFVLLRKAGAASAS
jgi:NhaA family Na+:H+ antiporter